MKDCPERKADQQGHLGEPVPCTTRHPGYAASQRVRKRIEEAFGWMKTIGGMRRPMLRGTDRVGWAFTFAAAAYYLICLPKLLMETF